MQTKKPRSYTWAALLFVMASILAFSTPVAKAEARFMQCKYIHGWFHGSSPCEPYYSCTNEAAWPFSDKCYAHWGMADAPRPDNC
jgi:hypothetical protein